MERQASSFLRRSTLIIPAHKQRFIDKALKRGADAIQLDLEDGVPFDSKSEARKRLKQNVAFLSNGSVELLIRVNNERSMIKEDLQAGLWSGLNGIVLPKIETVDQVKAIEEQIDELENERNLVRGRIHFTILIETAKGFMNMREIVASSSRIIAVNLGTEDFLLDSGITLSESGTELLFPKIQTVLTAKAEGVQPLGLIGSITDYSDLDGLAEVAKKSYQCGFVGSSCIHPDQVSVLNKAFSPTQEELDHAAEVVRVYEKSGGEVASLNGKMIDRPIAQRAYQLLEKDKGTGPSSLRFPK